MSSDCIFCKIIAGEIPSEKVFENDLVYAFKDINPAAKTHILVIPKKHISSLNESSAEDQAILGELLIAAGQIAKEQGIDQGGYRTVINTGANAGQTVFHIHAHIIGGQKLGWPPFSN